MFEIILGIIVCSVMGKFASASNRSAVIWGAITFVLCAVSLLIPLPFLRIGIAGIIAFVAMTFTNKT